MFTNLLHTLQQNTDNWELCKDLFQEKQVPAKTTLLHEGEIAQNIFFIKKGCVRIWFNNDGKDITFQFFFEEQAVASFESFFTGKPSLFSVESIEPTTIITLNREDFNKINTLYPEIRNGFQDILLQRMSNYAKLFLSRIKNNPRQRYEELLKNNPEIIQRVPQHYIASYLGITPISLSRIRNKR